MQPAEYHRRGWKAKPVQILRTHDDGTVDLGDVETGELLVGHCAVYATLPEPGERRPDGWALVTEAEPPKKKRGRPRKDAAAEPVIESLPEPEPAPVELDRDPEEDLVDAAAAADESAPQI